MGLTMEFVIGLCGAVVGAAVMVALALWIFSRVGGE